MDNNFNPIEEGFMPAEPLTPEGGQTGTPAGPAPSHQIFRYQSVKKAFSKAGLAFLLLYLVVSVVGSAVMTIPCVIEALALIADGALGDLDFQSTDEMISAVMELISEITPTLMLWSSIGTGVGIAVGMIFEKLILKKVPAEPIKKRRLSAAEYFFYLLIALGLWAVGVFAGNFAGFFGLESSLDSVFSYEGVSGWVLLIYGVFGAPALEELVCRKVLLDKLHAYGEVPAAFFSALLFGLFHGNSTQFPLAFAVGMAFALVYMKTGNILYTISFHMIINSIGSVSALMELLGFADEAILVADIGLYILLAVLAVAGCALAIVKRRSPLLKLERADYAGGRSAVFKNAGYIIFKILMIVTVVYLDLANILLNIDAGALCLFCLVPTVLFFAIIIFAEKAAVKQGGTVAPAWQE